MPQPHHRADQPHRSGLRSVLLWMRIDEQKGATSLTRILTYTRGPTGKHGCPSSKYKDHCLVMPDTGKLQSLVNWSWPVVCLFCFFFTLISASKFRTLGTTTYCLKKLKKSPADGDNMDFDQFRGYLDRVARLRVRPRLITACLSSHTSLDVIGKVGDATAIQTNIRIACDAGGLVSRKKERKKKTRLVRYNIRSKCKRRCKFRPIRSLFVHLLGNIQITITRLWV